MYVFLCIVLCRDRKVKKLKKIENMKKAYVKALIFKTGL